MGGRVTGTDGLVGTMVGTGAGVLAEVVLVLGFKIFLAAAAMVCSSGFWVAGLAVGFGWGTTGAGGAAGGTGGGTTLAVPAVLGLRSGVLFFSGVDTVFDFITEKPLNYLPILLPEPSLLHKPLPMQ
jgi:hypothetical protein